MGAGTAKYRRLIEPYVTSYETSDLSPGPGIDYVGDFHELRFSDATFDTIFAFQVLEHVEDSDKAVSLIRRWLTKGGTCIVTAPFLVPQHEDPGDFRRFTRAGLVRLFEAHGLVVVESGTYGQLFTVVGEFLKVMFLNPYREDHHGRIRRGVMTRLIRFFYFLDQLGISKNSDVYANVTLVAKR